MLCCGLRPESLCIFSGVSGEGLSCRQILVLPMNGTGLPGRKYKAVCGRLLPVLDMEKCVGVLTVNQGCYHQY